MDDEQNIVAPDIQNGVIRQQVILLQAVAVEAGLLRFEPGLHGGADSLLLRRIAQLEQQKLLGLHVCLRVIEQAAVKIGRIQAVQALDHLHAALLQGAQVDARRDGGGHILKGGRADRLLPEAHHEEHDGKPCAQPAQQLKQDRFLFHLSHPPLLRGCPARQGSDWAAQ